MKIYLFVIIIVIVIIIIIIMNQFKVTSYYQLLAIVELIGRDACQDNHSIPSLYSHGNPLQYICVPRFTPHPPSKFSQEIPGSRTAMFLWPLWSEEGCGAKEVLLSSTTSGLNPVGGC